MADYYAKAASNTFHVIDAEALRTTLDGLAVEVYTATKDDSDPDHVYLVSSDDKGCWPSERWNEDSREGVPIDLPALIAPHLLPGGRSPCSRRRARKTRTTSVAAPKPSTTSAKPRRSS
jgi:hypothetical protein